MGENDLALGFSVLADVLLFVVRFILETGSLVPFLDCSC